MSVASTSQMVLRGPLRRVSTLQTRECIPTAQRKSYLSAFASSAASCGSASFSSSRLYRIAASPYSTTAFQKAQPNTIAYQGTKSGGNPDNNSDRTSQSTSEDGASEQDPDEPPKKATIRERLRFLSRRYGWWALGVYLLASVVDFSLVFVSIHFLGADHIRDLEDRLRKYIGMGKREMEDHEVAAWPVPAVLGPTGSNDTNIDVSNNEEAARKAAHRVNKQEDVSPATSVKSPPSSSSSPSSSGGSGTLWTEAVLAYTIHKTLLLPFRVGATAAITPSFVKYMVKLGWASDNAAVQKAAKAAKMARDAAKAKAASSTPK